MEATKTRKEPQQPAQRDTDPLPEVLRRSAVCRKVPLTVRGPLDQAILLRPADCPTLEAIAARFELQARYGVSLAALRSYARKLEQLVRPAAASELLAGVVGCLPEDYRHRLVAGSQVLLLSRVIQALAGETGSQLTVAELARLAAILGGMAGERHAPSDSRSRRRQPRPPSSPSSPTASDDTPPATGNPHRLAEAVRTLYGLPWPITGEPANAPQTPEESSENI